MPATSLSNQLKALAGNRPPPTKGKVSLLFSGRQAADLDKDTLFAIGRDGLNELTGQNQRFAEFEETLFAEGIKSFDRTLQTKADNAKLDASIQKFLRLLSPYFLQQSSFKVLEWLLRRFRVHEFNVDSMLECILPYHETKQFAQVLSVLAISDTARWSFLSALQKTKTPLDRTSLVQRCVADHSILHFMCNMATAARAAVIVHRTMFSFFTCTVLQYIQSIPSVTDADVHMLLPTLFEFLKLSDPRWADLQSAAQIIVAQIAQRVALDEDVVQTIVGVAATGATETNLEATLLFWMALCQSQKSFDSFPESAVLELLGVGGQLTKIFTKIGREYDAEKFLRPVIIAAVQSIKEDSLASEAAELVESIIRDAKISPAFATSLCDAIFTQYLSNPQPQQPSEDENDEDEDDKPVELLRKLIARLHTKFPKEVDAHLESRLQTENKKRRNILFDFISNTFKGTLHEPIKELKTTLYLSLQHPEPSVRRMAVQKLATLVSNSDSLPDFTEDVILDRLGDDNEKVLAAVLAVSKLEEVVEGAKLVRALQG
ncbi:HEAT repeat-containing protein 1, partial [Rhizophlyctis rosea]